MRKKAYGIDISLQHTGIITETLRNLSGCVFTPDTLE